MKIKGRSGDEMNIHVASSLEAMTELKYLSASKWMLISPQSSKPNMCIVQDSLLGAYKMTLGIHKVTKEQFFNISLKTELSVKEIQNKIQLIRKVFKEKGKKVQCFHGKGLISLILPDDLIYEKKNNADPNEPIVKIYRGVLYEGTLDKNTVGAVSNSLIQVIFKEYGPDRTASFIDGIQFVTNAWLLVAGFSVGLADCMVKNQEKVQEIQDVIQKCYLEAEQVKTTTTHPGIKEVRIMAALGKAKDMGLKIAKNSLDKDNNFISTVTSGSKGDFSNICQITGVLGQQIVLGSRVKPTLNNARRTLPHYSFDESELSLEDEYESRGFVSSSFIIGLNPKNYYFHSMSGREGCSDTAMNTSTSGYIQRRIIKLTEDIKINYDNTVRDSSGCIYQLSYGEDGFDPKHLIKVGKDNEICNITSIVNKLNLKYELSTSSKKK